MLQGWFPAWHSWKVMEPLRSGVWWEVWGLSGYALEGLGDLPAAHSSMPQPIALDGVTEKLFLKHLSPDSLFYFTFLFHFPASHEMFSLALSCPQAMIFCGRLKGMGLTCHGLKPPTMNQNKPFLLCRLSHVFCYSNGS